MTDKKLLEEFREFIDFMYESIDLEDHQRFIAISESMLKDGWFKWIYKLAKEQAERVHELEKRLRIYQKRSWFEDYEKVAKQNKRYREAIEKALACLQNIKFASPDVESCSKVYSAIIGLNCALDSEVKGKGE